MTDENIIKMLDNIEGISTSDGLKYCGSLPAYLKFLNSYRGSIESKAVDIEKALERCDYDTYTSKAHQLKSTSRIIGAATLSDLAEKLETAGKTRDIEFIKNNNERFLDLYRSYYQRLSVLKDLNDSLETGRKEISKEEIEEAYRTLSESISMMDYDAVETVLGSLKEYALNESDGVLVKQLSKLLNNMQWDEMEKVMINNGII